MIIIIIGRYRLLMNFYNPVLQARSLELGWGEMYTAYALQATLVYPKSYKYWFCFKQYFFKKPFAILYLNATRAFTEVSWCETYIWVFYSITIIA